MTDSQPEQVVAVRIEGWATPGDDMTMDELVDTLTELGNTIVEIDYDNNRVKVCDTLTTQYPRPLTVQEAAALGYSTLPL